MALRILMQDGINNGKYFLPVAGYVPGNVFVMPQEEGTFCNLYIKKKRTKVKKIENRETRNEKLKKEKKGKRKVKVGSQHKQLIWKKRKKEKEKDSRGKRTWKWALPIDLEICRNKGWIRTLNSSALVSSKSSSNSLRKRTYLVDECDYVCVCLCMSVCLYMYLTLCTWTFLC